ncbi:hypothetical protein PPL_05424 [Heterostelium album PN500]|uniref:tRNA pseudouridine(55) synthase n=1 Tax=Heterostelium pallidum (strain ATCC 26659 / Pp 5 / PN500) TaxID=670386 RepID=D3BA49_HETP5|nr:hypothetical protein PPL_05424 [Heterostelium album PN500]EFA81436.1 hypothetical protein PPL_05424 [Heterostelium album PN500]|eukprot:XP_020433554.1 hypothetical protein PPL_05424 [Heterostelium album PN500]
MFLRFYPKLKHLKSSIRFPQNGILPIYKDIGVSSANVTNIIKYLSEDKNLKVGHGGTLDMDARGLLIVGFGNGCKDLNHFLGADKTYNATAFFGYVPPRYSAIKVDGERLSDWAAKGASVIPKARDLKVYSARCTLYKAPFGEFEMEVSSGFYVRSYLTDIAKSLNTVSYVTDIYRTRVGPFSVESALRVDELNEGAIYNGLMATKRLYKDYFKMNELTEIEKRNQEHNKHLNMNRPKNALLFDYSTPKHSRTRPRKSTHFHSNRENFDE